ncbi:Zn-dependent peptidase ImmA, M78 family [Thermomonospora echinospora]|uniref:Zn-dependent peptidase ImmA, M78 family n=1 Tax=Thermomonospora echinospora TaxID=1992 RepID=A0A1H6CSE3_9ACTN|nr:ImmA/IrrE family metallo-endopeptidase [Thermomonospora echinospora]SEG75949.1 Zn-dependent peptidase ImmA, M78 family [Thermomonospora echinospora]
MGSLPGTTAQASMLVLARESRGMTQTSLAAAMSALAGERVSQGYVSKAEAGRLAVEGDRLALYAKALEYPAGVLCADPELSGIGIGLVHHRKKAALGAQALRRIHAQLALARLQVRALIGSEAQRRHRFERIAVSDLDTPAEAAQSLRKLWNLPTGPIPDLVGAIERAGGLVLVRDLETRDLDAVSQWDGREAPLFLLSAHAPADRFRFSLAHELGHIVMHPEPGTTAVQERQADEFASELLMPASDIAAELNPPLDLTRLLDLKRRWGVSMAALARKALTLAVISEWQYRNLMIEMSTLGYRTQEPGEIWREVPRVVPAAAQRLVHEHGLDRAADLVGVLPEEFVRLFSPEPGSAGLPATG